MTLGGSGSLSFLFLQLAGNNARVFATARDTSVLAYLEYRTIASFSPEYDNED